MADALPLELPGTRRDSSTPLGDVAREFRDSLPDLTDPGDRVLVVMIEQLAATIDSAARYGKASAAAMAAKELREAIARLQDRGETSGEDTPEGEFMHFRDYMLGLVTSSAGEDG